MTKSLLATVASIALLQNSHAVGIFTPDETVNGQNNLVTLKEYSYGNNLNDPNRDFDYNSAVGYEFTVAAGQEIAAFFVSHNDSSSSSSTSRPGWHRLNFNATNWQSGSFSIGDSSSITTLSLGSFASLFGTDSYASLYHLGSSGLVFTAADNGTRSGDEIEDFEFHIYNASPATEIVALNSSGTIIDRSVAAVPEPSSTALLGLGALGLMIRRKR